MPVLAKAASVAARALRAVGLQRVAKPGLKRNVYAGATLNRLNADWVTSFLSGDQSIRGDFRLLRDRSRQLERDNAIVARYVAMQAENIIGPVGIQLKAQTLKSSGDLDRDTNKAIETAWSDWSNPESASVDGLLSMTDVAGLAVARWKIDGESLIRIWRGFDNKFAFAVQVLDGDLLDHTYNRAPAAGANEIRMGVERNQWGRPVAYHMWTQHPSDYFGGVRERVRIAANEIIHLYTVKRPGQTRGVPAIAAVMSDLNSAGAYQEAEIIASRVGASNTFFITQDPDAEGIDPDAGESVSMEVEPGVGQRLGPGEDVVQFNPTHPVGAFGVFMKSIYRTIAAGLGVAYSSLTGDLESANYSSLRDGSLKERDAYKRDQIWISIHLYRRIYLEWMKYAVLSSALKLPSKRVDLFAAHAWIPRGWPWVDPEKDIRSAALAVAYGFDTRTNVCAANGRDFEDNVAMLSHEQEIATEAGVTLASELLTPTGSDKAQNVKDDGTGDGSGDNTDSTDNSGDAADNKDSGRALSRVA